MVNDFKFTFLKRSTRALSTFCSSIVKGPWLHHRVDHRRLLRVVRTAEKITRIPLPTLQGRDHHSVHRTAAPSTPIMTLTPLLFFYCMFIYLL